MGVPDKFWTVKLTRYSYGLSGLQFTVELTILIQLFPVFFGHSVVSVSVQTTVAAESPGSNPYHLNTIVWVAEGVAEVEAKQ